MATVTRTYMIDDLNGSEDEVETVHFAVDGAQYEIDLNPENATRLREKLERFIEAASQVKTPRSATGRQEKKSTPRATGRDEVRAIREWATANGYEVSATGRISKAIQEAFDAAH